MENQDRLHPVAKAVSKQEESSDDDLDENFIGNREAKLIDLAVNENAEHEKEQEDNIGKEQKE